MFLHKFLSKLFSKKKEENKISQRQKELLKQAVKNMPDISDILEGK